MRIAIVAFADQSAGDDAVADQVISGIRRDHLPTDVVLIKGGTDALRALESIRGMDGLVVIDAATMGERPGTVRTFTFNELVFRQTPTQITLHGMKPGADLLLANKFLNLPPTRIVCIEPESLSGDGLSRTILSRMDAFIRAVNHAVRELHRELQ